MTRREELVARVRRLFPPSGPAYELFDCAVFVAVVVSVSYVIETPQAAQRDTLGFVDQALSLTAWGAVLTACALIALVCSYVPRWLSFGYGVLAAGCAFWAAVFVVGVAFYDGQPRSLVSALIYLWVLRRIVSVKRKGI